MVIVAWLNSVLNDYLNRGHRFIASCRFFGVVISVLDVHLFFFFFIHTVYNGIFKCNATIQQMYVLYLNHWNLCSYCLNVWNVWYIVPTYIVVYSHNKYCLESITQPSMHLSICSLILSLYCHLYVHNNWEISLIYNLDCFSS